jgi:hypothetical protein
MGTKLDLRKAFHDYYSAGRTPELRTIDPGAFLTIEGRGAPGGPAFQEAMRALYSVAYTTKFQLKLEDRDFTVGPLEGEWWTEDGHPVSEARPELWRWKLMIRLPDFVDGFLVKLVKQSVVEKKHVDRAADVVLELVPEERCVQVLHLGPYATEQRDLRKMDELIVREGLIRSGHHHEVYLNDPRRVAPDRVETILRQPVR